MEKQPLFSIIVPCYNASKYVAETIDSVLEQDYGKWELVLINDGSKDATLDILKRYAQKDKRIAVYDIPNGGVSKARNYGLNVAHGDWIMFLDSDDWFEPKALSTINGYINKNPKCRVFGFNHYYNSETKQWQRGHFKPSVLKRNDREIEWFKLDTMFPYYDAIKNGTSVGAIRGVWGKAFNASIIQNHKLRFIEKLKISEDAIFCLEVFSHANEVILFDDYLIHYRVHSSSAMNKYSPDIININNMALLSYSQYRNTFLNKSDFDICYLGMVAECLFRSFKLYLLHKKCKLSYKKRMHLISGGVNTEVVNSAFKDITLHYLPVGKKQLVYCAKKKWYNMMFLIAYISIKILEIKKK